MTTNKQKWRKWSHHCSVNNFEQRGYIKVTIHAHIWQSSQTLGSNTLGGVGGTQKRTQVRICNCIFRKKRGTTYFSNHYWVFEILFAFCSIIIRLICMETDTTKSVTSPSFVLFSNINAVNEYKSYFLFEYRWLSDELIFAID